MAGERIANGHERSRNNTRIICRPSVSVLGVVRYVCVFVQPKSKPLMPAAKVKSRTKMPGRASGRRLEMLAVSVASSASYSSSLSSRVSFDISGAWADSMAGCASE